MGLGLSFPSVKSCRRVFPTITWGLRAPGWLFGVLVHPQISYTRCMCAFPGWVLTFDPPAQVVSEVSGLPGLWVQTSLGCDPLGGAHHNPPFDRGETEAWPAGACRGLTRECVARMPAPSGAWFLSGGSLHHEARAGQLSPFLVFCKLLHRDTPPPSLSAPHSPPGPGRPGVSDHQFHLNPTCRRSPVIDDVLGPLHFQQHCRRCLKAL